MVSVKKKKGLLELPDSQIGIKFHQMRPLGVQCSTVQCSLRGRRSKENGKGISGA